MTKVEVQKIKLSGRDFVLIGRSTIATVGAFKAGLVGYASLDETDHLIRRYHKVIGSADDIEFGNVIEIELSKEELVNMITNMLFGSSWSSN